MGALLKRVPAWVWLAGVAAALAIAYGLGWSGYVGYDSLWALVWGHDIAHLHSIDVSGVYPPTPHPLLNLIGAVLSPLGFDSASDALELASLASLVLLAYASFRLGRALFSVATGVAFAALLITRPDIAELALYASADVPFLALVLLAAALEAERPRRGTAPLVALAFAGLLRPEAWLFSLAYLAWTRRPRLVPLALSAPVLWLLHDLVLTGDPIASFHGTREVADHSRSSNGLGTALDAAPGFVNEVTGVAIFACGVIGWLLVTYRSQERIALPAALFGLSFVPFLVYGAAGLTLYPRFLLPAAAALALLCAAALAGEASRPAQVAVALALAVSVPFTVGDLGGVRNGSERRAGLEGNLLGLVAAHEAQIERCGQAHVPSFRLVPLLMTHTEIPQERFLTQLPGPAPARTLEVGLPPGSTRGYVVDPRRDDAVRPETRYTTGGLRVLATSPEWRIASNC